MSRGHFESRRLGKSNTSKAIITNNNSHNATLTVNTDTRGDSIFAGKLADNTNNSLNGKLSLIKTGTHQLVLNGNIPHSYTGTTDINDGELVVNSNITSSPVVNISKNGILSGSGSAQKVRASQGSVFSPGDYSDISQLKDSFHVQDLTLNKKAIYNVKGVYANDQLHIANSLVSGNAQFQDASVRLDSHNPFVKYAVLDKNYSILHANKGLNGNRFAPEVMGGDSLRYLSPVLSYTDHDVNIKFSRNAVPLATVATNANQAVALNALEKAPDDNEVKRFVLSASTDPEETRKLGVALQSTETSANLVSAIMTGSVTAVRSLPMGRLHDSLSSSASAGAPIAQSDMATLARSALPTSSASPLWAEVYSNWRTLNGNGQASGLKQSTDGIFIGSERAIGANWKVGAALSYANGTITMNDYDANSQVKSYSATLYGGRSFPTQYGQLNLSLGGSYTRHDIQSKRHFDTNGLNQRLQADYHANTNQVFGELGYAMPLGHSTIEPFIGANVGINSVGKFDEEGGSTAVSGKRQDTTLANTTLGLRVQTKNLDWGKRDVSIRAMAGWRHAYGNTQPESTVIGYGQTMKFEGLALAKDTGVAELGVDLAVNRRATLGVTYNNEWGKNVHEQGAKLNVKWKF